VPVEEIFCILSDQPWHAVWGRWRWRAGSAALSAG
jgi:hypothetical protein